MSAFRTADGLMGLAAVHFRDADDVLQDAEAMHARDAAGIKTVFDAFSASASPESVRGYGNSGSTVTVSTPATTATPVGGVAPYSPVWTRTDGGGHAWTIGDDHTLATNFNTDVDSGASETATFICTITDATGAVAVSNEVAATAINLGGGL